MKEYRERVSADDAGVRLDAFLARLADITRSRAQALIREGCALVNGAAPTKAGVSLRQGDEVQLHIPAARPIQAKPQQLGISALYQDERIAVVEKPRGMVVHPSAGHEQGTMVNALLAACEGLSGIGGALRPGIVHRLDKDTTGLLVIAKDDAAHLALSDQFRERSVLREYLALAHGTLSQDQGRISAPIARHPKDRKRMAVVEGGREAITRWTVVERLRGCTLVRLSLETGRTHQIRVHLRALGHPLLGDAIYGIKKDGTPLLMLHASALGFVHPGTGEEMRFAAPPPQDFIDILRSKGYAGDF